MIKWIKQYGWYFAISILGGTLGAVFSLFIWHQGNLGTIAEWVSGLGSLGAIVFAYWQMHVQRKQYEKDKILANRPFFSCMRKTYLKGSKDKLWLLPEDEDSVLRASFFKRKSNNVLNFKKKIAAYEFTNVSKAVATSVVLKIEYQNRTRDEVLRTDYCKIKKCVMGNEEDIILPTSIINEPSTYADCPKDVYLYFTTIDDRAYCQKWIGKKSKLGSNIKEIPKEEIPSKRVYSYSRLTVGVPRSKDT